MARNGQRHSQLCEIPLQLHVLQARFGNMSFHDDHNYNCAHGRLRNIVRRLAWSLLATQAYNHHQNMAHLFQLFALGSLHSIRDVFGLAPHFVLRVSMVKKQSNRRFKLVQQGARLAIFAGLLRSA